jgi:hypothetical protein
MTPNSQSSSTWLTLTIITVACVGMTAILMAALPQPAQALPPRPTVPPTPTIPLAPESSAAGAQIQLQAQFPASWPWQTTHWQDLWTVVQWQDAHGAWHVVEGWQGTLDTVEIDADGTVTGYKTWWVGEEILGQGPLRWQVYGSNGGSLLATSEPFHLPSASRITLPVNVMLP